MQCDVMRWIAAEPVCYRFDWKLRMDIALAVLPQFSPSEVGQPDATYTSKEKRRKGKERRGGNRL